MSTSWLESIKGQSFENVTVDATGNINTYNITAAPITPNTTGQRYFFTDQSGVIRANPTGTANINSTPLS